MDEEGWAVSRKRLLDLLRRDALKRGSFTLRSGQASDYLIDCKEVAFSSEGLGLIGRVLACFIGEAPDAVAGVELGGYPLALTAAVRLRTDAVFVRKQAKDHGSGSLLEGAGRIPPGGSVVLVEDVVTTGHSALRAAEILEAQGFRVRVVALVDRGDESAETFASAGYYFEAVFTADELLG